LTKSEPTRKYKYRLFFVPSALDEWRDLDGSVKEPLRKLLRKRLDNPHVPGGALRGALEGYYFAIGLKTTLLSRPYCVGRALTLGSFAQHSPADNLPNHPDSVRRPPPTQLSCSSDGSLDLGPCCRIAAQVGALLSCSSGDS
jgi:hypothetical protein